MRRVTSVAAIIAVTLVGGASPVVAQNITQHLTTTLSGRPYQPEFIRFTAQGSEAIVNLSRVNGRCTSTTACVTASDCSAFPGATCSGAPLKCQVPVDALVGQVAVIEAARFCELAACAGVSVGSVCTGSEVCPAGQTYCGTPGSCVTCPAAYDLCLCAGGVTCLESDAALGTVGVPLADGFDDGGNPNLWLFDDAHIDNTTLDSRLVLGPGSGLVEGASVAVAGTRFRLSPGTDYVLFLKHAVNPRQSWAECYPAGRMSVFLTSRAPQWCDLDDDGYSGTDCDPANGQVWGVPGEPGNVLFSKFGGATDLSWVAPASPGGTPAATTYRVYGGSRSDLPSLLNASADSCLVATSSAFAATIPGTPAPGALAWYLVRAGNSCAEGAAGTASAGPRIQDVRGCDDGIDCTLDTCDASLGCVHSPNDAACDDANPCTTDACNPASGCVHTNNTAPCNDNNPCTTLDACSGGACAGGPPASCDDSNVCTDDSCNPGTGCVHTNNTAACDDGSACTTGDVCSGGICSGPSAGHLVISQVQTAGANADDEFVEIYNPNAASALMSGLSLQYKAATGSSYSVVPLAGVSIPAHGWYLVARSTYTGSVPRDQTNTAFQMAAAGGNLFLVVGTSPLSGTCSSSGLIIDKVGYGTGNCSEGSVAPAPGASNSILRKPGGSCGNGVDTNDNAADFQSQIPGTPRNRFSTPQP